MQRQAGKRSVAVWLTLCLVLTVAFGMAGCTGLGLTSCKDIGYKQERFPHTEDFYYSLKQGKRSDGTKYKAASIHGLTDVGKTKEIIVIPREIDGYTVNCLTYTVGMMVSTRFESEALKKMYIPDASPIERTFYRCPNLEKVIFYEAGGIELEYSSWRKLDTQTTKLYISSYKYDENLYRGNIYRKYDFDNIIGKYFANVSYMYNYENAEHNGYYWIDDYDYGTKIDFVPKDPAREGYVFDGWYREPECIRKWDFAVDTLPEEVTEEDEDGETIVTYQETRLYAKWTEK